MDDYDNLFNNICRICLKFVNSKNMVSLLDANSEDGLSCYGKAVIKFSDIKILPDFMPTMMCVQCLKALKMAIKFKFNCETSHSVLKNFINYSRMSNKSLSVDDKKNIIEYLMLKHYFPDNLQSSLKRNHKTTRTEDKKSVQIAIKKEKALAPNSELDEVKNSLNNSNESNEQVNDILDITGEKEEIFQLISTKTQQNEKETPPKQPAKEKKKLKRRTKKDKNSLTCPICGKVLANPATYDHHLQRHKGCRYICEHCGKGFPVLAYLNLHMVSKHKTGDYIQCSQCTYKTARRFEMVEHERIHTGERPYSCDRCGLTFRRHYIWKKHLVHHSEKKFQCPQCPWKFYSKSEVTAHLNNIHERKYMYMCQKCGVTYAKSGSVRRHMLEKHEIPRELQGRICRIGKNEDISKFIE